jgi:hypothetical protein
MDAARSRSVPSSFDLSAPFELREIPRDIPWPRLEAHIARIGPTAVLGHCPLKLQLDVGIYAVVSRFRIPYLTSAPYNTDLACELVRRMGADLVVATAAEAATLSLALAQQGLAVRSWHIIAPIGTQVPVLPGEVVLDEHEFPGKPYGS